MNKAYLDELYEMKFAVQSKVKELEERSSGTFPQDSSDYDVHHESIKQLKSHLGTIDLFIDRYIKLHTVKTG